MAVTPAGIVSLPLKYLRDTLAASATFRTLTGAADAAAALRHIRYYGINQPSAVWATATAYTTGMFLKPDPAYPFIYECTTAGTSGASEPTWPQTAGGTIADGATCVWTARAKTGDHYMTAVRTARPFAIIGVGEEFNLNIAGAGPSNTFFCDGSLLLVLEMDVPAANIGTYDDAGTWAANQLGAIMNEMRALAGQAGYLDITAFKLLRFERGDESSQQSEGDFFQSELLVSWRGL